jgi:hypothetical protein
VSNLFSISKGQQMNEPKFRDPVFLRDDEHNETRVSAVVWVDGSISIKFSSQDFSVLVDSEDWNRIDAAVRHELGRLGK